MKTYRDRAIILRTYKLGEADRIVVLLGEKTGQIRAVAKGIRKPTSRFGARLTPFNLVDIQLHEGRTLETITQAELLSGYGSVLADDYAGFTAAKVMVEATQKLTDSSSEVEPAYFRLLHGALAALSSHRQPPDLLAAAFLLRAMAAGGWRASVETCASCGAASPLSAFSPEAGGFLCAPCAKEGSSGVAPGTAQLAAALMTGQWDETQDASHLVKEQALTVASKWAEWHLEGKLRTIPYLKAES